MHRRMAPRPRDSVSAPRYLKRPTLFLVVAIVVIAQFIPLPYVIMQPGPAFDLLAHNIGFALDTTTATQAAPASPADLLPNRTVPGTLYALTVYVSSPDAHITAPIVIANWIDGHAAVLPRDFIYPKNENTATITAKSTKQMATSESVAKSAAINYINKLDPTLAAQLRKNKVTFALKETGGPSAGLGFALALVAKVENPQLINSRKIAVTGTIDESGTVGAIGGIDQKLISASAKGATIALIPADNCADLTALPAHVQIVPIHSLSEAVDFLAGRLSKVPHC